jgi:hypothetical protein
VYDHTILVELSAFRLGEYKNHLSVCLTWITNMYARARACRLATLLQRTMPRDPHHCFFCFGVIA